MCNGTIVPGSTDVLCGTNAPFAALYDPSSRLVFVANAYGFGFNDWVTAYDAVTWRVAYSVFTGWALDATDPSALTLDNASDTLYIAEQWGGASNGGQVVAVNATSGVVVARIPVSHPRAMTYDPDNHEVYVAGGANSLNVIDSTTRTWVANISGVYSPDGLLYDHAVKELYASEYWNNTVVAYSPPASKFKANITVATGPGSMALDPRSGDLYVADHYSSNISVIDTKTNSPVATLGGHGLSGPYALTYDSVNDTIYVANWGTSMTIIAGSNHSAVGSVPINYYSFGTGITYDPLDHLLVYAGATLWFLDPTNGYSITSTNPIDATSAAYDPVSGTLFVADRNHCDLLPVNISSGHVGAPIPAGCQIVGVVFDPADNELFTANDGTYYNPGYVTILNASSGATVATVGVGYYTSAVVYDPASKSVFALSYYNTTQIGAVNHRWLRSWSGAPGGYSGGLTWDPHGNVIVVESGWVRAINATNHTLFRTIQLTGAGSDAGTVDPATGVVYVVNAGSGNMTRLNATTLAPSGNIPLCYLPTGVVYDPASRWLYVSCNEDNDVTEFDPALGLVVGVVSLGSSGGGSSAWPNGIAVIGSSGELVTANAAGTISIISTKGRAVSATSWLEAGLPVGSPWSVSLTGLRTASTTPVVTALTIPGATYSSRIYLPAGYSAQGLRGRFAPVGATPMIAVGAASKSHATYGVSFRAMGLERGVRFGVTVGGEHLASTFGLARFLLPNGTYPFQLDPRPGYLSRNASGTIIVYGGAISFTLSFTRLAFTATFSESGLPNGTVWTLTLNGHHVSLSTSLQNVSLENGTYRFAVRASGYVSVPTAGYFTVAGAAISRSFVFS